jgi:AhpD family alkylhydroperoxidase
MARLQPAEPKGLIRRLTFRMARRMYGRDVQPTQILAHHRPLLLGYGAAGLALERYSKTVDAKLKHLAMLRASQLMGCEWCLDFGSWLAQNGGCSEQQLRELSTWPESAQFDEVERLVLEYTDAMTRTPVQVSDPLFARLKEHFDEPQIVELTMAIALENLYSRTNWALGIEGQGFSEGMYCVRPATEAVSSEDGARLEPTSVGLRS